MRSNVETTFSLAQEKVREFLVNGNFTECFKVLDAIDEKGAFKKQIVVLQREFIDLKKEENLNISSKNQILREKNSISVKILDLTDEIIHIYNLPTYRKNTIFFFLKNKYSLFFSFIVLMSFSALIYKKINDIQNIHSLDLEISNRIEKTRKYVPKWAKNLELMDTPELTLTSLIFDKPNTNQSTVKKKYKKRNLMDLLVELKKRVSLKEKEAIATAINKLEGIHSEYSENMLMEMPDQQLLPFCIDLIDLNIIRWYSYNKINHDELITISEEINGERN